MTTIAAARSRVIRLSGVFLLVCLAFASALALIPTLKYARINAAPAQVRATVGGCPLFPANNIWNTDISQLPVQPNSATYLAGIGLTGHVHADFGSGFYNGAPIGIPYVIVPDSQPAVPVSFQYAGESDPGPYPIPPNAPIEGGAQSSGDRHVIVVDSGTCKLYEMFAAYPQSNGSWHAGSGATWSLNANALRPATWTSADAAGLPILPGLARYDEVASGAITHALRFTVSRTQNSFLWPARHQASSSSDPNLPPMGLRLRLKASVNISSFSRTNQIILTALKRYGMFVADNGSSWYISGAPDNRWNNDDLHALGSIPGSDFEVVDESSLQISANSGQSKGAPSVFTTPSPTHTSTTNTMGPHATEIALTPAIADTSGKASEHGSNTISHSGNGTGNIILLVVCGSIALLLGALGVMLSRPWIKRSG